LFCGLTLRYRETIHYKAAAACGVSSARNRPLKFDRITECQAYERVVLATSRLWERGIGSEIFESHPDFIALNLNYRRCTTGGFGQCGQGEYSGLVVTDGINGFRVISMFVDTLIPEDTKFEDITDHLGKYHPNHVQCDICYRQCKTDPLMPIEK
jgi:hypothetical protein